MNKSFKKCSRKYCKASDLDGLLGLTCPGVGWERRRRRQRSGPGRRAEDGSIAMWCGALQTGTCLLPGHHCSAILSLHPGIIWNTDMTLMTHAAATLSHPVNQQQTTKHKICSFALTNSWFRTGLYNALLYKYLKSDIKQIFWCSGLKA